MAKKMLLVVITILLIFSAFQLAYAAGEVNLIQNPSFEDGTGGNPAQWSSWAWKPDADAVDFKLEKGAAHTGNNFVTITNNTENDARYAQTIKVEEGATYKLSCWIKTENVGKDNTGANISLEGRDDAVSNDIKGTNGKWEQVEMYIVIGSKVNTIDVSIGLGGYGSTTTGKASFDDVAVEKVQTVPQGVTATTILPQTNNNNSQPAANPQGGFKGLNRTTWLILMAVIIVAVLVVFVMTNRKPKEEEAGEEEDENSEEDEDPESEADVVDGEVEEAEDDEI